MMYRPTDGMTLSGPPKANFVPTPMPIMATLSCIGCYDRTSSQSRYSNCKGDPSVITVCTQVCRQP